MKFSTIVNDATCESFCFFWQLRPWKVGRVMLEEGKGHGTRGAKLIYENKIIGEAKTI